MRRMCKDDVGVEVLPSSKIFLAPTFLHRPLASLAMSLPSVMSVATVTTSNSPLLHESCSLAILGFLGLGIHP